MTDLDPYTPNSGSETIFTIPGSSVKFGPGALREVGEDASAMGLRRVALFTDQNVSKTPSYETLVNSLK